MRVPRVYGSATDVYRQNNYLNNSSTQGGEGCVFHADRGAHQTFIHGKIIISINLNPKWAGDAKYTRIRERVRLL